MAEAIIPQDIKDKETSLGVEKLCEVAKGAHSTFVAEHWHKEDPDRESFHDESHISSVWKSAEIALELEGDPLGVWNDLEKWNDAHDPKISPSEFKVIAKLAIHAHDMGNIMQDLNVEGGEFKPVYHQDGYKSDGAEARSQKIFEVMINSSEMSITEKQKAAFIALGQQLIGVTVPNFVNDKDTASQLFRLFMETCDQVGGSMNSEKPLDNMLLGLAEELDSENKMPNINLAGFYNFAYIQLDRLMGDNEDAKEKVKEVWRMEGDSRVDPVNWPDENMKREDFIAMLKARIDEPDAYNKQISLAGAHN